MADEEGLRSMDWPFDEVPSDYAKPTIAEFEQHCRDNSLGVCTTCGEDALNTDNNGKLLCGACGWKDA